MLDRFAHAASVVSARQIPGLSVPRSSMFERRDRSTADEKSAQHEKEIDAHPPVAGEPSVSADRAAPPGPELPPDQRHRETEQRAKPRQQPECWRRRRQHAVLGQRGDDEGEYEQDRGQQQVDPWRQARKSLRGVGERIRCSQPFGQGVNTGLTCI